MTVAAAAMPLTTQAPDYRNIPTLGGVVRVNEEVWQAKTQPLQGPLEDKEIPGSGASHLWGQRVMKKMPNVGISTGLQLIVEGTVNVALGTGTATFKRGGWDRLIRSLSFRANTTSTIQASSLDLRARLQRVTAHSNLSEVEVRPSLVNGSTDIKLVFDVPFVTDLRTLMGKYFAESNDAYFQLDVQFASPDEVLALTGNAAVTFSGMVMRTQLNAYGVAYADLGNGVEAIVPDLSTVFMFQSSEIPIQGTGRKALGISRAHGQLMVVYGRLDNGSGDIADPMDYADSIAWAHGLNQVTREFTPPRHLMWKNAKDYNGLIQPGYFVIDLIKDNSARDAVIPDTITELNVRVGVKSSFTVNSGASFHLAEETLIASDAWAAGAIHLAA